MANRFKRFVAGGPYEGDIEKLADGTYSATLNPGFVRFEQVRVSVYQAGATGRTEDEALENLQQLMRRGIEAAQKNRRAEHGIEVGTF